MQSNGPLFDSLDFDICGQDHCPKNSFFFFLVTRGKCVYAYPIPWRKGRGYGTRPI